MALIKCNECGKEISDKANQCPNCGNPISLQFNSNMTTKATIKKGHWSTARLCIGITSIILSVLVLFYTVSLWMAYIVNGYGDGLKSINLAFVLFTLIAGIASINTRDSEKKTGAIIAAIFYWLASFTTLFLGFFTFGFGVVFIICAIKTKKEPIQGISARATMNYFNR